MEYFKLKRYSGGVRERVFKTNFNLTKVSLFKYEDKIYLGHGMHAINGAELADIEGAVMHTKFMHDFGKRVNEEAVREEHFNNACEYKIYNEKVMQEADVSLKNSKSIKIKNTKQFIDLGMMKTSKTFEEFINSRCL